MSEFGWFDRDAARAPRTIEVMRKRERDAAVTVRRRAIGCAAMVFISTMVWAALGALVWWLS